MERQPALPFRFSDPRHERIYQRLLLIGPGPAAFFRDASRLREEEDQDLKSVTHLVAHLLREIESAIRDVLEPLPITSDEPALAEDVRALRLVAHEAFERMGVPETHSVYQEMMNRLTSSHKNSIKAVLRVLAIDETSQLGQDWLKLTETGYQLGGKAHRVALNPPRLFDAEYREYLLLVDTVLDGILEAFEHRYFVDVFLTLDTLLSRPRPTKADLNELRNRVPQNWITLGYFFDHLSHPNWLQPLRKKSFFAHPPASERYLDDGVRFPRWPQSQCLARMARSGVNARLIAGIIESIPETENPRIQIDLIEAIRYLPVDAAIRFLPRVERWIEAADRTGLSLFLGEHLGPLIVALAQDEHAQEALRLSDRGLSVRPLEPALRAETTQVEPMLIYSAPGTPGLRIDEHDYEDFVREISPALIAAVPDVAFSLLCRLLGEAITVGIRHKEPAPPEDYSSIWRPAIEQTINPRSGFDGVRDVLVTAVRDAGEDYCRPNPSTRLPTALNILRTQNWWVFRRIECHLARVFAQRAPTEVWKIISNRSMFNRDVPPHEYQRLLHDAFGSLTSDQRATILSWVEAGPDREAFELREVRRTDAPPNLEEIERHTRLWQWRHLRPIRDSLSNSWGTLLDHLDAEFHNPAYPEPDDGYSPIEMFWMGPTSPLTAEELATLQVSEIVDCIESWEPSGERRSPSLEGFARVLGDVVKGCPERFAEEAMAFARTGPTIIGWVLHSLGEALKSGAVFPWSEVLRLCRVAVESDDDSTATIAEYVGSNQNWMRRQVSHLLQEGFIERLGEIPFDLRETVWEPLSMLHTDSEPTRDQELRFLSGNLGLFGYAMNTVRGSALEAAIGYALWVVRHGDSKDQAREGFSNLSEVQEVLALHLDPAKESSLAIRSIYGSRLNQLVFLDREWVQQMLHHLFPSDIEARDAVWHTFLAWGRVDLETFTLFREQYRATLESLNSGTLSETTQKRSLQGFAEHLMTLFWWGELDLDEPDQLLQEFFESAPADARAHAISFLGRSLDQDEVQLDEKHVERLQQLWDWRIESCGLEADTSALAELKEFGWWFISGRFDNAYSISKLQQVLALSNQVTPSSQVAKELVRLCERFPFQAVTCLELLLDDDGEERRYIRWHSEARTILRIVLANGDAAAGVVAKRVVNRLVARGFVQFRELVDQCA